MADYHEQTLATAAGMPDDRAIPHPPGIFQSAAAAAASFIPASGSTPQHQSSNNRGSRHLSPKLNANSASIISHFLTLNRGVAPSL